MNFNDQERAALIMEKKEQIAALKREIAELEAPKSLARLLRNKMIYAEMDHEDPEKIKVKCHKYLDQSLEWTHIKAICMGLCKPAHGVERKYKLRIQDLTHEEAKLCAQMTDRIIEAWNDAVLELYSDYIPESQ